MFWQVFETTVSYRLVRTSLPAVMGNPSKTELLQRQINLYQSMFKLATLCCIFPFKIFPGRLEISLWPLSIFITVFITEIFACYKIFLTNYNYTDYWKKHSVTLLSGFVPQVINALLTPYNAICLSFRLNKLYTVFHSFQIIDDVTGYKTPHFSMFRPLLLIFFLNAHYLFIVIVNFQFLDRVGLSFVINIHRIFIVIQFTFLVESLGNYYSYLLRSLTLERAYRWTRCHEMLTASCDVVTECYSIQLLLIVVTVFLKTVSDIYRYAMHSSFISINLAISLFYSFTLNGFLTWHIVHRCSKTKREVPLLLGR